MSAFLDTHIITHCIIIVIEAYGEDSGWLERWTACLCFIYFDICNVFNNYVNTVRNIKTHERAHMSAHAPGNSLVKLDEHFMQSR